MLKIRCSALGKIMTNSRSKSEVLSKTCKTYLQELAIEEMYGIKKEFSSRYTDKGNLVERESIDLAQDVLDYGFMYKNEEHFNNDFLTGTPDVNTDNILLDVKVKLRCNNVSILCRRHTKQRLLLSAARLYGFM